MTRSKLVFSLTATAMLMIGAGVYAAAWLPLTAPPQAPETAAQSAPASNPTLQAQQREPVQVDGKLMESKLLERVAPVYPEIALRGRMEGTVDLEVLVNEQGLVARVRIIRGGYPPLQPAAAEAVRQWRYQPTYLNGEAVPVLTTASVTFKLPGAATGPRPAATAAPNIASPSSRPPTRVGGAIQESKLTKKVVAVYPEVALRARVETTVILELLINEQGEVANIRIIQGHPLLDAAAMDAVKQWRYQPTYLNGEAVPVLTTATVTFKLPGAATGARPAGRAAPSIESPSSHPPVNVGGALQESKLIKRVEPVYPEIARQARIETTVILEVLINEQGEIANIRIIRGHPLLDAAAMDAVKQWRYQPTYLNGEAVPVITTQSVVFKLTDSINEAHVVVAPDGSLKDLEGNPASLKSLRNGRTAVQVPFGSSVPFAAVEQALRFLQDQGIRDIRLISTMYGLAAGRLFYATSAPKTQFVRPTSNPSPAGAPRVAVSADSGMDPSVRPAVLDVNLDSLAAMAKASGRFGEQTAGSGVVVGYTVFVTELGEIVAVEGSMRGLTDVETVLRQARVLSPGNRGGAPVPTAVQLFIPIR